MKLLYHSYMYHILRHWGHQDHYLYRFAMVVFLYAILNGIISFILPIYLEETISSLTLVGLILASSSVWNIATDLVLGFLRKPPSYRLLTKLIGSIIFALFLMIWLNASMLTLVIATALWGIYTEMFAFANFDFVVVSSSKKERAEHFGLMYNFYNLGFALAPIMIGLAVVENKQAVLFTGTFFSICLLVLFYIQLRQKKLPHVAIVAVRRRNIEQHLRLWLRIRGKLSNYLWAYFAKGIGDGALTSFVPIFVAMKQSLTLYGGFIMAGLSLPTALLSGYFGSFADKFGRHRFIVLGLLLISICLLFFGYVSNPLLSLAISLLVGVAYALFVPPLDGQVSQYVEEHYSQEAAVESESGVMYNLGFIFGAGITGFLVVLLGGFGPAFAVLGVIFGIVGLKFWLNR